VNLLIAGSRDIDLATAYDAIEAAYWVLSGLAPDRLITGDARGVDQHGVVWWLDVLGDEDTIDHYPADWDNLGKRAGYVRNMEMAQVADQAIIVWDSQSRGTNHMLNLLAAHEVETVVVTWQGRDRKRQLEHRRYE
jgi:hypothetical protein